MALRRCLALSALFSAACRSPTRPPDLPQERWYQTQYGYGLSRPAILGDLVYFGTGDGHLIARDRATGVQRWATDVSGRDAIGGANLLVRSGVAVAAVQGFTVGVDATTGQQRWRYLSPVDTIGAATPLNLGSVVLTHLDADDQTVYVPAWGASVSAVDLQSGAARWVWTPGGRSAGDTAVSGPFPSGSMGVRLGGDTLYATVWHFLDRQGLKSEAWLVALDRRTGQELWRLVMPSYTGGTAVVWGAPVVVNRLVLFSSYGGFVFAVDRVTHTVVWQNHPTPEHGTEAEVELYDDAVYFDGGDGNVVALAAADGSVRWRTYIGAEASRDLLVTARNVVVVSGSYLFILDRATGRLVSRSTAPHASEADALFASAAAGAAGQLFFTMNNGALCLEEP